MRLQTDPTVIYGMGAKFDGNLRKRDLETDTPYNTYTRDGLPPTPIALPSQASLDAVLNPPATAVPLFRRARRRHVGVLGEPRRAQPRRVKIPEGRTLTRRGRSHHPRPTHVTDAAAASSRSKASTAPARARTSRGSPTRIAARGHRVVDARASPAARRSARRCATLLLHEPMTHDTRGAADVRGAARARRAGDRARRSRAATGCCAIASPTRRTRTRAAATACRASASRRSSDGVHGDCQPDLTLLFDVPLAVSRARLDTRRSAKGRALDKFEREAAGVLRARARRLPRARAPPSPRAFASSTRRGRSPTCAPSSTRSWRSPDG